MTIIVVSAFTSSLMVDLRARVCVCFILNIIPAHNLDMKITTVKIKKYPTENDERKTNF